MCIRDSVKLVYLSGLTGESGKSIEQISKEVALELELTNNFKINEFINITQTFEDLITKKIIADLVNCNNNFVCLFDDNFITKLSMVILSVWENILESIQNASKYDKLIELYSFSVDFSDGLYNNQFKKPKITENFLDAGNSTKMKDSTKIKDLKQIEKNIDQSKVVKGMTAMLSSAVTNAVNKNSADLLRAISASNKISVGSASGTSFTLTKINQSNTVEQETNANFVQQVTTKVINDIGTKLQENIDMTAKQTSTDTKKLTSDEKSSTSIGGIIDSVANVAGQAIDGLAKTLSISAGNSVEQNTSKDITQELKDTFKLDQSFKYEKNDDVKSSLENILSTENLAKCAADTKVDNTVDLAKINVTGPIVISELEQTNVVNDVMSCAFNQTVMNDISNKILNDYNKLITQMVENVDTKLDEETKTSTQGDIYAAGVAGAAVLQAAGEGVSSAAQGVGKGVESAGKGVATAAKGVGEGISSAMSGLVMPLLIGAGILVILIIGYVIFKSMGGVNKSDFGDDDDDE
jgi:hypothetical protein